MMSKKYQKQHHLLTLLQDGHCHSNESLSQSMKIAPLAILQIIQYWQHRGIEIQLVRGKGFCIPNGLCFLDKIKILNQLMPNTLKQCDDLICLDQVESTNDYLLKRVSFKKPKILACFAEEQTQGKGRFNQRSWISPYANNIYHSLLWYFEKDPNELAGLSLAVAVFVTRALKKLGIHQGLELKWPNDILWCSQKLCGILIQMQARAHSYCAVVIGIGINTRLTTQKDLDRPITSTEDILNQATDRNQLAALLVNELVSGLQQFELYGLKNILNEWQSLDSCRGKMVKLEGSRQEVIGQMVGISDQGQLLLKNAHGSLTAYSSGEVSLKKLKD